MMAANVRSKVSGYCLKYKIMIASNIRSYKIISLVYISHVGMGLGMGWGMCYRAIEREHKDYGDGEGWGGVGHVLHVLGRRLRTTQKDCNTRL